MSNTDSLLVIAKEDLDRHPAVADHLEACCDAADLVNLFWCECPAIELKVLCNPRGRDALGDDAGAALQSPHKAVNMSLAHVVI